MTVISLRHRLEQLEKRSPNAAPPGLSPVVKLFYVLAAYHLGGLGPSESLANGVGRALGYETSGGFQGALGAGDTTPAGDDFNTRWRDAMWRLFALKGVNPECDDQTFTETLVTLFGEMPERCRTHPFLNGFDLETPVHSA